jgi:ribosomal protein S4
LIYWKLEEPQMSTARNRIAHKHFRLDAAKIKRAQRLLKTGTETETLERALDVVIAEHERNRLAREANQRFVKSGIEIRDVYAKLTE